MLVGEKVLLFLQLSLRWQQLRNEADLTGSRVLWPGHYEKVFCLSPPWLMLNVFLLNILFTSLLAEKESLL